MGVWQVGLMLSRLRHWTRSHPSGVGASTREQWITNPRAATAATVVAITVALVPDLIESGGDSWFEIAVSSVIVASPLLLVPRWPRTALAASMAGSILASVVWLLWAFEFPAVLVLAAAAGVRAATPWVLVACGTVSLTLPWVLDGWLYEDSPDFSTSQIVATLILGVTFAALSVGFGTLLAVSDEQAERLVAFERAEREAALEGQRHAIARELHDVAAHHLAALSVRLRTEQMVGHQAGAEAALAHAAQRTDEALASMRQIVHVLRSESAAPGPPSARVEDLEDLFARMSDAGVQVQFAGDTSAFNGPPALEMTIVRVVQEALTNVLQHSETDTVSVAITDAVHGITVIIEDPGPSRAGQADARSGFGLIGLAELVGAVGGSFVSEANPRGGWSTRAAFKRSAST